MSLEFMVTNTFRLFYQLRSPAKGDVHCAAERDTMDPTLFRREFLKGITARVKGIKGLCQTGVRDGFFAPCNTDIISGAGQPPNKMV